MNPPTPAVPEPIAKRRVLPFLMRYPIMAGALLGLLLRLVFSGNPGSTWSAMAVGFIWCVPVAVGAFTVYLAERQERRSWFYYFFAPAAASTLLLCGSLLILIEGIICAIVIVPMFAVMGGLGGLVMGLACRLTDWPRPTLYSLGLLPLLLGLLGDWVPAPADHGSVERSVLVNARPEVVWRHLNAATDIRPDEVGHAWAFRIGAPLPQSGVTREVRQGEASQGHVRESIWARRVRFEELVAPQDWEPNRRLRWTYRFTPESFPPGSLDDHVMIGGHYFDLLDTTYRLEPQGPDGDATRVTLKVNYRISTQFNLYANWVAQWLLGDFGDVILGFYKQRSERAE